jgi:hypothetical protein
MIWFRCDNNYALKGCKVTPEGFRHRRGVVGASSIAPPTRRLTRSRNAFTLRRRLWVEKANSIEAFSMDAADVLVTPNQSRTPLN